MSLPQTATYSSTQALISAIARAATNFCVAGLFGGDAASRFTPEVPCNVFLDALLIFFLMGPLQFSCGSVGLRRSDHHPRGVRRDSPRTPARLTVGASLGIMVLGFGGSRASSHSRTRAKSKRRVRFK